MASWNRSTLSHDRETASSEGLFLHILRKYKKEVNRTVIKNCIKEKSYKNIRFRELFLPSKCFTTVSFLRNFQDCFATKFPLLVNRHRTYVLYCTIDKYVWQQQPYKVLSFRIKIKGWRPLPPARTRTHLHANSVVQS
jgi:hypothetical protein